MLPLAGLLFNVISSLVVDKATDLATEHVENMLDDICLLYTSPSPRD